MAWVVSGVDNEGVKSAWHPVRRLADAVLTAPRNAAEAPRIATCMNEMEGSRSKLRLLHRYVQSICGLYSRIARQLQVDRSYVSRVARGERRSPAVENALTDEFTRIMDEGAPAAAESWPKSSPPLPEL